MADNAALANPYIISYISNNANNFSNFAQAMNLPPTAAVAVSEEARGVMFSLGSIGNTTFAIENPKDFFLDTVNCPGLHSNAGYAASLSDNYVSILNGTLNQANGSPWNPSFVMTKAFNPMSDDVGMGNENCGSASVQLISYLNSNQYGYTDPLGLTKYLLDPQAAPGTITQSDINFQQFFSDLRDVNSSTTAAVAVLNVANGYNAYSTFFGSAFTDLASGTDAAKAQQIALMSTFYKGGVPSFLANDSGDSQLSFTMPTLSQISNMTAGPYALLNWTTFDQILRTATIQRSQ